MESIRNLAENATDILGSDLKELVMAIKNSETAPQVEVEAAIQVHRDYFTPGGENIEPLPTVYYYLWENKAGALRIRRNLDLSPKNAEFLSLDNFEHVLNKIPKGGKFKTNQGLDLRAVIALNLSIRGQQLKDLCLDTIKEGVAEGYAEYQQQLAQGLLDKFYSDSTKEPKDSIFYKVRVQTTGVPQLIRDLKLSPRQLSAAEREWNAAHPDDI